ncbi:unnamed protein product [Schistosoma mattheei]|uniref:Uncharacterized protein n=1 Tax=Schistosoma mattheei TaxID=31246 RepID=A0A3P8H3M5_9TREM|nr:unnamed protein product [Schistosoma mattheei]
MAILVMKLIDYVQLMVHVVELLENVSLVYIY